MRLILTAAMILNFSSNLANAQMPAAPSTPFDKTPYDDSAAVDESFFIRNTMKEHEAPGASTLVEQMYPSRSYLNVEVLAIERRRAQNLFAQGPVELDRVITELNIHDLRPGELSQKLKNLLAKYYILKVSVTGGTVPEPPRAAISSTASSNCANSVEAALREFLRRN